MEKVPLEISRGCARVRVRLRRGGRAPDGGLRKRGHATRGGGHRVRRERTAKGKVGPGQVDRRGRRRGCLGDGREPRGRLRVQAVQSRRRGERGVLPRGAPRVCRRQLLRPVSKRHQSLHPSSGGRDRDHPRRVSVGAGRHTHLSHLRASLRHVRRAPRPRGGPRLRHVLEQAGQLLRRLRGRDELKGGGRVPGGRLEAPVRPEIFRSSALRRVHRVREERVGVVGLGRGEGSRGFGAWSLPAVVALGLRGEHAGLAKLRRRRVGGDGIGG